MRKLVLYMTMTFDGFLAGPNNELDWFTRGSDQELNNDIVALLDSFDTGIIGYPTAPGMISYWREVAKNPEANQLDRELARAINRLHAVILSNTQVEPGVDNAEVAVVKSDQDLINLVNDLKQRPGKSIGVPGGVRTGQKFARLGLVDEYVLMMHPVAIGTGKPLFTDKAILELMSAKAYASGVVRLRYLPCP